MPRISTFMYAERTEPNQQGQMTITNPLITINPMFVPGMFSFSIIFGIVDINNDSDHTIQITFNSPNDEDTPLINTDVISLQNRVIPLENEVDLPLEQKNLMFNLDFRNVVLKTEGLYKSKVYIDGTLSGEYPIYVKAGETQ